MSINEEADEKERDQCLAISKDRKAYTNANVSRFNSLTESFQLQIYTRSRSIGRRRDGKPVKGWFIKAPKDLTLYNLPYNPTNGKLLSGTKAQFLLRANYGFFPDLWIKIQSPDSSIGWIKTERTSEYREFME